MWKWNMSEIYSIAELPEPVFIWEGMDGAYCLLYGARSILTEKEAFDSFDIDYGDVYYSREMGIFLQRIGACELLEGPARIYLQRDSIKEGSGAKPHEPFLGFPIFNDFHRYLDDSVECE